MKNLILGVVFLAAGIGLSIWGNGMLQEAKASKNWPSVTGTILSSGVSSHQSTSGSGSKKRTSTVYEPSISYRYEVGGKSYTSDRITTGDYASSSAKRAHRTVAKFPEGSKATVFYDPKEPYLSVLEPGTTFASYIPFGSGLIFAFIGAMVLLGGIFRMLKKILRFAVS